MIRALSSCAAALLAVLVVALTPALAAGPAPSGAAADAGLSQLQAHRLLTVLDDPMERAKLIDNLQALEKALPPPGPASVPAVAPAPAPAASTAIPVAPGSLLSRLPRALSVWAAVLADQLHALRRLVRGLPVAWQWLASSVQDPDTRSAALETGAELVAILLIAWLVERGARRLLRPATHWLGRAATPAHAGPPPRVADRIWAGLRRFALALCHLVLELIPVGVFAAIGNLVLGTVLGASGRSSLVILAAINAYIAVRIVLCVTRMLVAPDHPGWRLVPVSGATAGAVIVWVRRIVAVLIFGLAAIDLATALGLEPAAGLALQKLVLLVDHVLLVVVVVRSRAAVAALIRPSGDLTPAEAHRPFARLRTAFASIWHVVAIFLIMALWVVWAADLQGGYAKLLRFMLVTGAVMIVARLVTNMLLSALDHLGQTIGNGAGSTDPRMRMAHYLGLARRLARGAVSVVALLVLLELWGANVLGWVAGTPLGRQMLSAALTIVVTLVLAVAAWEGVNLAVEQHLARLTRESQMARIARLRTLLPILRTALLITILLVVALTALSEIGVNVAPLLAGAGILGVAIGFGSQKLVQDFITGIFLLLENAMQVGDTVTLAGVSGTVENLSIRTIRLRAGDGSVHIIPFSSVTMVNNTNRGLGNAAISVTVSNREDTDAVGEAMKQIVQEMRADHAFSRNMLSDLQLWGVDRVDGAVATLVGQVVCTDSGRWGVQREFNRRYKKRFEELGIALATDTRTVRIEEPPRIAAKPAAITGSGEDPGETTATVRDSPPPSALGHSE